MVILLPLVILVHSLVLCSLSKSPHRHYLQSSWSLYAIPIFLLTHLVLQPFHFLLQFYLSCGTLFGATWASPYPPYSLQCGQLVMFIPCFSVFLLLLLLVHDLMRYLGGDRLGYVDGVQLQCRCWSPFVFLLATSCVISRVC